MPDADMSTADGKGNDAEPDAVTAGNPGAPRGLWAKRSVRAAASVAAALLVAGVAVGVTLALRGSGSVPAAARIPSPPAKDAVFVEDDNGAGQDQQDSVLQYSAPGVVSIRSESGADLGSGFVITRHRRWRSDLGVLGEDATVGGPRGSGDGGLTSASRRYVTRRWPPRPDRLARTCWSSATSRATTDSR
jgi:hypothetical protein